MTPEVTVVICTYNPRLAYLGRVLDALRRQTLPLERWELIVVDNGSRSPVSDSFDLRWHPNARHLIESAPGVALADRRAFLDARADLIVFVDDDNVLDDSYLEAGIRHFQTLPSLGCCGPAVIRGEFEKELEPEMTPYLWNLSVFTLPEDRCAADGSVMLPGAGLFCRRALLGRYFTALETDPKRRFFRSRHSLGSMLGHEDADMIMMIGVQGYAAAQYRDLGMTHLIPSFRLTEDYLLRLVRGRAASVCLLGWVWGAEPRFGPLEDLRSCARLVRVLLRPNGKRSHALAAWRGQRDASRMIAQWTPESGSHES